MRDSNPQPTAPEAVALPVEPTLSQPVRRGIGIRHGSAARTGRDTSPYRCCRSRSDCGRRLFPGGDPVALQRGRWNGIAMRVCVVEVLCERRNENAPGMESEGIRVASEDRGDRSPVEEPVRSGARPRTRTTRAGLHRAWAAMAGRRRLCGSGMTWFLSGQDAGIGSPGSEGREPYSCPRVHASAIFRRMVCVCRGMAPSDRRGLRLCARIAGARAAIRCGHRPASATRKIVTKLALDARRNQVFYAV